MRTGMAEGDVTGSMERNTPVGESGLLSIEKAIPLASTGMNNRGLRVELFGSRALCRAARPASQRGEVHEGTQDVHLGVQPAILGQIAHAGGIGAAGAVRGEIMKGDPAAVGLNDLEEHADQRRLAGTVGSEKREDLSALHGERQVCDRGGGGEPLEDAIGVKEGGHDSGV